VIAVLGGLGAAVAWAISTLCSSRSSRLIEPAAVVAWVLLVGLVVTAPIALSEGVPSSLDWSSGGWLALAGVGNVVGLWFTYAALRRGQVALVAPLVSTEGAIAAVIALLAGESLAPGVGVTLATIAVGIGLSTVPAMAEAEVADGEAVEVPAAAGHGTGAAVDVPASAGHGTRAAVAARPTHAGTVTLAGLAALCFGTSLYATARAGAELPAAWVVLSARVIGAVALALPLAALGRLHLTRPIVPLVVASGVCEVLGFFSFTAGSRHGIAIAAVLSSQFASLAAFAAYVLFHERLTRIQFAGVCTVIAGVAVLSALRA
jgi:drug/metabolite transporter (DMT)-like permease